MVDVRLPPSFTDEGVRAAIEARQQVPGLPILILSQYVEQTYARELLTGGEGGVGYLLKDRVADPKQFVDAVRRGRRRGHRAGPRGCRPAGGRAAAGPPRRPTLTPREREVLTLMAEGRTNAAIAESLVVTERAVEKHVSNIFWKLGLTATGRRTAACSRCSPSSAAADRRPIATEERAMPSIPTTLPRLKAELPDDLQLNTASVGAASAGALAVGAFAVGALAVGALAVGAMAIGRLAIRRLAVQRGSFGALSVGELDVDTLRVRELVVEQEGAGGPDWADPPPSSSRRLRVDGGRDQAAQARAEADHVVAAEEVDGQGVERRVGRADGDRRREAAQDGPAAARPDVELVVARGGVDDHRVGGRVGGRPAEVGRQVNADLRDVGGRQVVTTVTASTPPSASTSTRSTPSVSMRMLPARGGTAAAGRSATRRRSRRRARR